MNKGIIIGVVVVVIIAAIIGSASSLNLEKNDDISIDNIVEEESVIIEESIIIEESTITEEIVSEPENQGRDLSVELTETVALRSP